MKALFVVFASLLFSSSSSAESIQKPEVTDTFSDAIKSINEEDRALLVNFEHHTAFYKVGKEHPQFTEIKAKLEKAQKIDQKVKVVAIIPSMTIKEIKQ